MRTNSILLLSIKKVILMIIRSRQIKATQSNICMEIYKNKTMDFYQNKQILFRSNVQNVQKKKIQKSTTILIKTTECKYLGTSRYPLWFIVRSSMSPGPCISRRKVSFSGLHNLLNSTFIKENWLVYQSIIDGHPDIVSLFQSFVMMKMIFSG